MAWLETKHAVNLPKKTVKPVLAGVVILLTLGVTVSPSNFAVPPKPLPPFAVQPKNASLVVRPKAVSVPAVALTPIEQLGKAIFFDRNLSNPPGQACASCHVPANGFAAPPSIMKAGIAHGVIASRFGFRNAPTASYAAFTPALHKDSNTGELVGGLFWDLRAADAAAQARGPFINPVEMNNPNSQAVVQKLRGASYANLFKQVFGQRVFNNPDTAYTDMSEAIAAFERSKEVSPFSSKYDLALKRKATFTVQETRGLHLFMDPSKGNCIACHSMTIQNGNPPLFTSFKTANIGVPRNRNNPFYTQPTSLNAKGQAFVDTGIGGANGDASMNGKFRIPTLRNVALTPPYMHNGVFQNLTEAVRFHNSACAPGNPDHWDPAEVSTGRNCKEVGNLHLTEQEIADIVVFLTTLSDGYKGK